MSDDAKLPPETRAYVDDLHGRLDQLDLYEVLGVARTVDRKEIKRAYFHLVGLVHPDRYFGKDLGPYQQRLEAVFARVTAAYETLWDRDARAAYDAQLGTPAPEESRATAPLDPATAAKRREAMAALQARFAAAPAKAKEHTAAAARARAAGDLSAAEASYRQALVFAPHDAALQAAHAEVARLVAEKSVVALAAKAAIAERLGQWEQAASAWQRVVLARPDDAAARARLVEAMFRAKKP